MISLLERRNGKHYVAYSIVYIDFANKQSPGIYNNNGSATTYT